MDVWKEGNVSCVAKNTVCGNRGRMATMRSLWIIPISLYQQYISPHKGFHCAHRLCYGDPSCSEAVKEIILAQGLLHGLSSIRDRFRACATASKEMHEKPAKEKTRKSGTSGKRRCGGAEFCPDTVCVGMDCLPELGEGACSAVESLTAPLEACEVACSCWPS